MEFVSSLKTVNEVLPYRDVEEFIKTVDFDVFCKGPDQIHRGFKFAEEFCKQNNKELIIIPRTEGVSSSMLRGSSQQIPDLLTSVCK